MDPRLIWNSLFAQDWSGTLVPLPSVFEAAEVRGVDHHTHTCPVTSIQASLTRAGQVAWGDGKGEGQRSVFSFQGTDFYSPFAGARSTEVPLAESLAQSLCFS